MLKFITIQYQDPNLLLVAYRNPVADGIGGLNLSASVNFCPLVIN